MPLEPGRPPISLHWKISALIVVFGLVLALLLTYQAKQTQKLIQHPLWRQLLVSATEHYLSLPPEAISVARSNGVIRGWRFVQGQTPAGMPPYLATLPPGYYDEHALDRFDDASSYAALITPLGVERLVMVVDMTEIEATQNHLGRMSMLFVAATLAMTGAVILWLYGSLKRPVQDLAQRMDRLDPEQPAQRLPVDYADAELRDIAVRTNQHLERVERFIERERSLLDQASHEFRTPIAVIAGAVDVLRKQPLPPGAEKPLARIRGTVDTLTEIMAALLYLSREPDGQVPPESTRLDGLLPELVNDHQHLLQGRPAQFALAALEPLSVPAPEAMVRIVIGNLLRNAAENTYEGTIEVQLAGMRLVVRDPGAGFDTVEAARRYTASLRGSTKPGGGRGLGLFLVRRICERFQWTLTVASSVSQGTTAELAFR